MVPSTVNERLATLEERVFVAQTVELEKLALEIKNLNHRLNVLILLLVGNFGISFLKALPLLEKLL